MVTRIRQMSDLSALKQSLAQAAQEAEAEKRAAREQAERQERERRVFELSIGKVSALKPSGQADLRPAAPLPLARQTELNESRTMIDAFSDDFDPALLLETDDDLSYCREGVSPEIAKRLRKGQWSIQSSLDLHGLRTEEARQSLTRFLAMSRQMGRRCVRVIHGKGHGSPGRAPILKSKVRSWLAQCPQVIAYVAARADEGGHGALVVLLDA